MAPFTGVDYKKPILVELSLSIQANKLYFNVNFNINCDFFYVLHDLKPEDRN